jgi:phosphate transport system substrate-binding protein
MGRCLQEVGLNYQSLGSGGGIKQIEANTVTFGASDMPLKGGDLDKNGLVQFPTVMGGVVAVVILEGIHYLFECKPFLDNLRRR